MIKGCQKKIIYLKSPDGGVFEEAYFVLRQKSGGKPLGERDMVKEATRIISGAEEFSAPDEPPRKTAEGKRKALLFFFGGAAAASAVFLIAGVCLLLF